MKVCILLTEEIMLEPEDVGLENNCDKYTFEAAVEGYISGYMAGRNIVYNTIDISII